jgi:S-adenosylmethionine hydrolase
MQKVITLTTDFGLDDGFVGSVKGVIISINPTTLVVDISHNISPQDILHGAFVLYQSFSYFPKGSIHLAIVDPGVGSRRKPVVIETDGYIFVGPDNGIFSLVLKKEKPKRIIALTNKHYFLKNISNTFHGRDIFAPVAAHLALGESLTNFGEEIEEIEITEWGIPVTKGDKLEGMVLHIDRFGNLITNISTEDIFSFSGKGPVQIKLGERRVKGLSSSYSEVQRGEPVALIGSINLLEIACNRESAHRILGIEKLDKIVIERTH